eukprot:5143765-Alexandrium_andersonii.AAC.1
MALAVFKAPIAYNGSTANKMRKEYKVAIARVDVGPADTHFEVRRCSHLSGWGGQRRRGAPVQRMLAFLVSTRWVPSSVG